MRVWDVSSLNITPISKSKFTKNIYTNYQSFEFSSSLNQEYDVAEREFTFSSVVKNLNFDNIRLFLNRKEYVQFNGIDTVAVKPIIKKIDNSESIIEYKMYLPYGENEIQLYATKNNETDIYISNEIKINCIDFEKSSKKATLYILNYNPTNYEEKKIAKGYSTQSNKVFCEELLKLKNVVYKNVEITNFNSVEAFNSDSIKNKIVKLSSNFKSYDAIILTFNGYFIEKNKSLAFLSPNSTLKDIELIYIDSIMNFIGQKIKNIGVINNFSLLNAKLENSFIIPDQKMVYDNLKSLIKKYKNFYFFQINNNVDGNPFDIFAKAKNKSADTNNNSIISIDEINSILQPVFSPYFYTNNKDQYFYLLEH
ncbi:MAG: hypothetical protein A2033_14680 [Bacteroidetes bacterium GWA2_31_9]|nr:MAG: hypothetical protein A2033_14680 [Bacteroidetes bacterium GWA2_31_9]